VGLLAVLGVILIVVGIIGLFHIIALQLAWALTVAIVGVLLVVFGQRIGPRL
jgi:hypothetical protein